MDIPTIKRRTRQLAVVGSLSIVAGFLAEAFVLLVDQLVGEYDAYGHAETWALLAGVVVFSILVFCPQWLTRIRPKAALGVGMIPAITVWMLSFQSPRSDDPLLQPALTFAFALLAFALSSDFSKDWLRKAQREPRRMQA